MSNASVFDRDIDFEIEELKGRLDRMDEVMDIMEKKIDALIEEKFPYRNVTSAFEADK